MNFTNEMAAAHFYPANVVEHEMTKKGNIGKKVMIVVAAAAIALTTGIGAAKICTDCLRDCVAYADPIEQTVSADAEAPGAALLAETLKSMGDEA